MITISDFLRRLREKLQTKCEVYYLHPTFYILGISDSFSGYTEEQKENWLSQTLNYSVDEVRQLRSLGVVQVDLIDANERKNSYEFLDTAEKDNSWLSWFAPMNWPEIVDEAEEAESVANESQHAKNGKSRAKVAHFYGYKGGQARSTVLLSLAKMLADAGYRVLLVDADVEAPSLDAMLDVSAENPNATLMGLCGWSERIAPISGAYVGQLESGTVDLIACRPKSSVYDMDFAAFLMNTTLDVRTLKEAARAIREYANGSQTSTPYDIILVDHRTGLGPSILPIMDELPGPAVIFVRPDGMSKNVEQSRIFDTLLSYDSDTPGMFVSFSLDPVETILTAKGAHGAFVERLLEKLSDAFVRVGEQLIDPIDLERSWVLWHHDRAFLSDKHPSTKQLSPDNQRALQQMREVLGFDLLKPAPSITSTIKTLSRSGATDEGWFIRTPDVARLFSLDNKLLYVLGRKGTGKTRLLRELQLANLGEPLLTASDYDKGGVPSLSPAFNALIQACAGDYEMFWWALLHAGIVSSDTLGAKLTDEILRVCGDKSVDLREYASPLAIERTIEGRGRRIFLIDGVETAVPAANLRSFVEALFRFMASIQYNGRFSEHLTVRLFLRSDLATGAIQNIEQQVEGHSINLRWDKTSILNFALGRIANLAWFREAFAATCKSIDELESAIAKGAVSDEVADELLLQIFPHSLERNRLKTSTFFATYFSDAGGDSDTRASFYPRLFDVFLRKVNDLGAANPSASLSGGRILSALVLQAYDEATQSFIGEVRSELHNLLELDSNDSRNRDAVDRFISSFSGLPTPFVVDEVIEKLEGRTSFTRDKIREALGNMKALGMFEDRTGFPGSWRTGRVYKSGLNMKYVRANRASN